MVMGISPPDLVDVVHGIAGLVVRRQVVFHDGLVAEHETELGQCQPGRTDFDGGDGGEPVAAVRGDLSRQALLEHHRTR